MAGCPSRKALLAEQWHTRRFSCVGALAAHQSLAAHAHPPTGFVKGFLNALVELYDAWHAAEPAGAGHDVQGAEWRAKLTEWQASTQPATAPSDTSRER